MATLGNQRPKQSTSSAIVRVFTPGKSNKSSSAVRPVGRPRGSLKHISPFTRQPIPAPQYYRELRLFKRQQQVFAQRNMEARMAQLARQGINPQQVQAQMQQQMPIQSPMPQPMQRMPVQQTAQQQHMNNPYARQMPTNQVQMQPHHSKVWRDTRYVDTDWGLFGPRQVVRAGEESFWN